MKNNNPLQWPSVAEVPLSKAPLIRVIAQIRFPLIVAIEQREFIASFQEAIREHYPILRHEQVQEIIIGPKQFAPTKAETAWRFSDEKSNWRASLAPGFIALETDSYKNHEDFLERLRIVISAVAEHIRPKVVDRFGLRYIDRVVGENANDIAKLVRLEMCGLAASDIASSVQQSFSEASFEHEGTRLVARWGSRPKDAPWDLATIEPISQPSWILDLDMFTSKQQSFDVKNLLNEAKSYADRIYAIFRWAINTEFLRRHGANL